MSDNKKYLLRELSRDTILKSFDFINEKSSKSKFIKLDNGSLLFENVLLQEADKINGNGRIYPYKILKKVVDGYQDKINIRQAVGALGHPNCIREGAKILTIDGWKDFRDISNDEMILTYNPKNENLEYQRIYEKVQQYVETDLICFKNKLNLETSVTENHRFYLKDRNGNGSFYTAKEIFENRIKFNHYYIPRVGNFQDIDVSDVFVLKKLDSISPKYSKKLIEKYSKDVLIDMDDWTSFLGLYLAEGHCAKDDRNYSVHIFQNEGEKSLLIEELLNRLPFNWSKKILKKEKTSAITYTIRDKRLNEYLKPLGRSWEKYIPKEMKSLKNKYLENIINWFHLGDGRTYTSPLGYIKKDIFSTSLRLIEDFSEILIKLGRVGNIKTEIRNTKDGFIDGRIIKKENRRNIYFLNLSNEEMYKGLYISNNRTSITKQKYSGNVYCVRVPNETFFCMDNNKIYISGNSAEIDPGKISHHIDKIWWEGKQVRGDVRVLSTQTMGREAIGLVESDITLGISSRSVGSVTKKSDHVEVNDDLELICWDLVIEPSTQNAYLNESKLIEINVSKVFNQNMDLHRKFDALLGLRGK